MRRAVSAILLLLPVHVDDFERRLHAPPPAKAKPAALVASCQEVWVEAQKALEDLIGLLRMDGPMTASSAYGLADQQLRCDYKQLNGCNCTEGAWRPG